ncbi:hypothetical protein SAMN04515647_2218 [Cohaesibacter sp. ES.047]|uniref:hypothetical protein n=1 Tax=Cohaesibacter sp. ES.047 TaxID=1798205 RepID=UPI000BC08F13|nr:hypothetical protein [Cohaesibacter sp. ES.047]SNY91974.1 hypothetical protein SAMN04515647_2218 [Cohaesibacter sp. ES.047]
MTNTNGISFEDQERRSASILNYAKIIALLAAGFWTWFQWDKTIFPQAKDEEYARKAAFRTGLDVDEISFDAKFVRSSETKEGAPKLLLISGNLKLKNNTGYPIAYFPLQAELSLFEYKSLDAEHPDEFKEVGRVETSKLTIEILTGQFPEKRSAHIVVEADKTLQSGISTMVQVPINADLETSMLILKFPFKTQPIDPITNKPRIPQEKSRIAQIHKTLDNKSASSDLNIFWSKMPEDPRSNLFSM